MRIKGSEEGEQKRVRCDHFQQGRRADFGDLKQMKAAGEAVCAAELSVRGKGKLHSMLGEGQGAQAISREQRVKGADGTGLTGP